MRDGKPRSTCNKNASRLCTCCKVAPMTTHRTYAFIHIASVFTMRRCWRNSRVHVVVFYGVLLLFVKSQLDFHSRVQCDTGALACKPTAPIYCADSKNYYCAVGDTQQSVFRNACVSPVI